LGTEKTQDDFMVNNEKKSSENIEPQDDSIEKSVTDGLDDIHHIIKLEPEEETTEEVEESITEEFETDKKTEENQFNMENIDGSEEEKNAEKEQVDNTLISKTINDINTQILQNKKAIESLEERILEISKDIEDLISLYEIAYAEMNPFVGISKVTSKRIESLENMYREIKELKRKIEALENSTGGKINVAIPPEDKNIAENKIESVVEEAIEDLLKEKEVEQLIDGFIEELEKNAGGENVNGQ